MAIVFLALKFLLSKVGDITPSTRSKATEIVKAANAAGYRVRFVWGKGSGEHSTGNALDIMVYDAAAGDFFGIAVSLNGDTAVIGGYRQYLRQKLMWRKSGFCRTVGVTNTQRRNHKSHGCYSTILTLPSA